MGRRSKGARERQRTRAWARALLCVALWCCAAGAETQDARAAVASAPTKETLSGEELRVVFDRKADPALRQATMQKMVRLAQAGHGYPSFYLGVLYRDGMDHPARLVERDVETARHWLELCVDSGDCPLMALASLAELELEADNAKAAMQWAQAWVVLDRESDKHSNDPMYGRIKNAEYVGTAYQAYLLSRCYKAMPSYTDPNAVGQQWFNELRLARGKQLDRMLFADKPGVGALADSGVEMSAENQRRKLLDAATPAPVIASYGLYLYEASPDGGRAESVLLIEGLPRPAATRGLEVATRSVKTKPYDASAGHRYALMPMSFDDGDYTLRPAK